MSEELYDVVIIGGGPAGLSAAQYASRAKMKTVVLDKSASAGALAFASKIVNYPGIVEPMSGKEMLDIFRKQAVDFGAEYVEAQVIGVNLSGNVKEIFTMQKTYSGKTVIIATGSMGRKATIKGEAEFLGRGVSYCAICDAAFFKAKKVCVLGDSEEAVKEAEYLSKFAETVYLIAPTKKTAIEEGQNIPANLIVMTGYRVTAIVGSDLVDKVSMVDLDNKESELELSGVFVYLHGNRPVIDYLGGIVDISDEECVLTNRLMETSIPGVFSAGDVTCTEVRQVVIAAANGCVAGLSAEKFVSHRKRTRYDWGKKD